MFGFISKPSAGNLPVFYLKSGVFNNSGYSRWDTPFWSEYLKCVHDLYENDFCLILVPIKKQEKISSFDEYQKWQNSFFVSPPRWFKNKWRYIVI